MEVDKIPLVYKVKQNKPIEIWGTGEIIRDYIFVEDLADAIFSSIFYETTSNVFNVGSGQGNSLNELIHIMRNVTGQNISDNYSNSRIYDVPEIYLDITLASNELNWKPNISLEQGITYTWDFIKNLSLK